MSKPIKNNRQGDKKRDAIPALEWIVSGLGFILVTASLGYLLNKAVFEENNPPDMQAQLIGSRTSSQGYVATVELRNNGGQTAADLLIVAHLDHQPDSLQREATVDFLPPQSVRQIELYFQARPTADNLHVEFISYHVP